MSKPTAILTLAVATLIVAAAGCSTTGSDTAASGSLASPTYEPRTFGGPVQRVSTAVPWPRGIVWYEGKLLVLSRGVHRSAGGPNADIDDKAAHVFEVDPNVFEPVRKGGAAGDAVRGNAKIFAVPTSPPFHIWDRRMPATLDTLAQRPYAGLVHDPASSSLFVICFSGIDLGEAPSFRKNATDAVHRYHIPTKTWHVFDAHDPDSIAPEKLAKWLPNEIYPHHDPKSNPPPHGFLNGPCGGFAVGDYFYATAKDNTALVQYDLDEVRRDPANAGAADGRYVFHRSGPDDNPFIQTRKHGKIYVEGACAVVAHGGYMYVAFRTTGQVIRFPIKKNGDVVRPIVADYLAQTDAHDPSGEYNKPANIYDMRFNSRGEFFISPKSHGAIWMIPTDGDEVFDATRNSAEKPYVNLRDLTDHEKAGVGNFCFDPDDNMYICSGNDDTPDDSIRGTVYRVPDFAGAAVRP